MPGLHETLPKKPSLNLCTPQGSGMGGDVESINQIKERKEKNCENSISSQNYPLE